MKVIYKYALTGGTGVQTIELPVNSVILSCVNQGNRPVLYAMHEKEQEDTQKVEVVTVETGKTVSSEIMGKCQFVSTVSLFEGSYILHVFVNICGSFGVSLRK